MSPRPRDGSGRERRYATVLFADVSGFTALSRRMDHEDVADVTNRCLDVMKEEVVRQGGYVVKRLGDAILAVFGAPKVIEDAPKKAVNAAIEMRKRVLAFAERNEVDLNIHTGINTGELTAGEAEGIYDVWGNTVNLASRIEGKCPKGSIYVGEPTHRYTCDDFEYRAVGPLELKNVEEPIEAFEVLSGREQVYRRRVAGSSEMVDTAFVGREAELAQLTRALTDVVAGVGSVVAMLGEPGIGKSRLVSELLDLEVVQRTTVLQARALAVGRTLAFHPFIDLLRRWAAIDDADDDASAERKLEAVVAAVMAEEATEVLPFVARLMGLRLTGASAERVAGIEGDALEKLILKSVRTLFLRAAVQRPVVVMFEDLHWADESSVKLAQILLRLVSEAPILFILIARRGDQIGSARPVLETARAGLRFVEISLEPLSATECHRLIENLITIEWFPPSVLSFVCERSGGNPFYLEEIIHSLREDGVLTPSASLEQVEAAVRSIPGTVQEVIMARVERLPEDVRHVLQIASVIGRSVPQRLLVAVIARDPKRLEWELRQLARRQILTRAVLQGEVQYVFKHALLQDTVYEWTSKKQRIELHGRVAGAIESLFGERLPDYYGMLAYHYSRAEQREQAEDYLFKAGNQAAQAAAPAEALFYFQEASRLYLAAGAAVSREKKALLEKNIGLALLNKGNLLESIEHFNEALKLHGEPIPEGSIAVGVRFAQDLVVLLSRLYRNRLVRTGSSDDREVLEIRYNKARAQTTADAQRGFFDTIGSIRRLSETNPAEIEQACGMYAGAAALFAYSGLSFAISRRFLQVAHRLVRDGSARDLVTYRTMSFVHDYLAGAWGAECEMDAALLEQGLRYGQVWDVNTYLDLNCGRKIRQGDWLAAEQHIRGMAELADVYGFDFARSNHSARTAHLLLEQGRLREAVATLDRYYAGRYEELLNLWALGTRAKAEALLADHEAATRTLEKAEAMIRRMGRVPPLHLSTYLVGRFLLDLSLVETMLGGGNGGELRAVFARARRSRRRAVRIVAKVAADRTEVYRLAGRLEWLRGRRASARRWWTRALQEGERVGARPELARSYLEIGRRLAGEGTSGERVNGVTPADCLTRARELFGTLDLAEELGRVGDARPHAA